MHCSICDCDFSSDLKGRKDYLRHCTYNRNHALLRRIPVEINDVCAQYEGLTKNQMIELKLKALWNSEDVPGITLRDLSVVIESIYKSIKYREAQNLLTAERLNRSM